MRDLDIIPIMSLSPEEVEHIALLARLDFSIEEKEQYRLQLSSILDHIAALQKLDTSRIPPTSSVLPPRSRLRRDEVKTGLNQADVLRNAPVQSQGQFRVPPILDR
jgi:aspartyl-tRNA(Asn)/glutamyl-tRNA(Gln) amidotransferase subunit C